jgi:flagellum-specific ATP synthase
MGDAAPPRRHPLQELAQRVDRASRTLPWVRHYGKVTSVTPSSVIVSGLSQHVQLGSLVQVSEGTETGLAEVVRIERSQAILKPIEDRMNFSLGARVHSVGNFLLHPHASWKGRLVDSLGRPADGGAVLIMGDTPMPLHANPPEAMSRAIISKMVVTGVRALDVFTPLCLGQRIGVFAGSGVGKSTLLSMLARAGGFDTIVVALVGERGREVREFVQTTLGSMARNAVTVVSTGDESPMMRRMAPLAATAIAEYFRDRGEQVLLVMDSVTRYAQACRDVALAAGEPPVARGFPPSVFSDLPRLLERAGPGPEDKGSITGIYAVLVEGDDHNDPVADAIRGTLDGHVVRDRGIAETGRFPAIDLLASISRLADRVWTKDQRSAVIALRKLVSRYEETRDLRAMGGYVAGADPELDRAIETVPKLYSILTQTLDDPPSTDAYRDIADGLSGKA